jgi:hypothetical protein
MNDYFAPHGEFKLHVSNNIIIARLTGSWNKECAEKFSQAFTKQVKLLKTPRWAHLVFLDDWQISVPEIAPVVDDLAAFCILNGLEKSAQVAHESMMKKMYLDKMAIETRSNFERRIFSDQDKAISWLSEYGFTTTKGLNAYELV